MFVEVPTRVVPATAEALEKFTHHDLRCYARDLGIEPGTVKSETIRKLLDTKKATLCASLGN